MQAKGMPPKAIIEGPPKRECPILLRQTSFKALEEAVSFKNSEGEYEQGCHTARFGEIEQRGVALTPKGRALYDKLLSQARHQLGATPNEGNATQYNRILAEVFTAFPDDYQTMHDKELAYFYYQPVDSAADINSDMSNLEMVNSRQAVNALINQGAIRIEPIVYEDFLPVSAAGIFQSNLQQDKQSNYDGNSNQQEFEQALGTNVYDELALYEDIQNRSLEKCLISLGNGR
jgi:uncharacterized glyoxalase superfamily metalloenzyme YdcJ